MAKIGAEMGQLADLQKTFGQQSQAVEQLTTTIDSRVGNTLWEGPAADRFRNAWTSEFKPTLKSLREALDQASQEVSDRHRALEQAGT